MFKKYANDVHTTFRKKNDHQRSMFTKSIPNMSHAKHVVDVAKGVVDKINSLEK
jgi:hypothetical protein